MIERDRPGAGASARTAGLVTPVPKPLDTHRLGVKSMEGYRAYRQWLPLRALRPCSIFWCVQKRRVPEFVASIRDWDPREGTAAERHAAAESYGGLQFEPTEVLITASESAFVVNPRLFVDGCIERFVESSGELLDGVGVTRATSRPAECRLSLSDGREVDTRLAVLATGASLLQPPSPPSFSQRLRTKRIAALHLKCDAWSPAPVVVFSADDTFLMGDPERNRYVFSFTSPHWDSTARPDQEGLTEQERDIGLAALARRAPAQVERYAGARCSSDAYTPSGVPEVLFDVAHPCIMGAGGGSGSGIRMAPALAEMVANRCHALLSAGGDPHAP
jgi:glycine/D-amino acid oxidase-like deaminating enzyme